MAVSDEPMLENPLSDLLATTVWPSADPETAVAPLLARATLAFQLPVPALPFASPPSVNWTGPRT